MRNLRRYALCLLAAVMVLLVGCSGGGTEDQIHSDKAQIEERVILPEELPSQEGEFSEDSSESVVLQNILLKESSDSIQDTGNSNENSISSASSQGEAAASSRESVVPPAIESPSKKSPAVNATSNSSDVSSSKESQPLSGKQESPSVAKTPSSNQGVSSSASSGSSDVFPSKESQSIPSKPALPSAVKQTSPSHVEKETPVKSQETGPQIYRTKTGKKYHYENPCGRGTYYPCTLEEALQQGLEPCEKCVLH